MKRPVVLVHGAWHGPWIWAKLVQLLEEVDVHAEAVALPSAGADPSRLGGLQDDAAAVRAVLDTLDCPAVLVGHSYGGTVLTETAASGAKVAHLVFIAALVPDTHESTSSLVAQTPSEPFRRALRARPDGALEFDASHARKVLYHDCTPEEATEAAARLVLQSSASTWASPSGAGWRNVSSTYILCAADRAVHPQLQRRMATRTTTTVRWQCGHTPMLSRAPQLAALLAARAVAH